MNSKINAHKKYCIIFSNTHSFDLRVSKKEVRRLFAIMNCWQSEKICFCFDRYLMMLMESLKSLELCSHEICSLAYALRLEVTAHK